MCTGNRNRAPGDHPSRRVPRFDFRLCVVSRAPPFILFAFPHGLAASSALNEISTSRPIIHDGCLPAPYSGLMSHGGLCLIFVFCLLGMNSGANSDDRANIARVRGNLETSANVGKMGKLELIEIASPAAHMLNTCYLNNISTLSTPRHARIGCRCQAAGSPSSTS